MNVIITDQISAELKRLESLGGARALSAIALTAARIARRLGDDAFRVSGADYAPWAPRKDKTKKHRLLQLSTALRKSLVAAADLNGAVVKSDRPYASYHQFGTRKMVARPFLPFDENGELSARGQELVLAAVRRKIETLLKA